MWSRWKGSAARKCGCAGTASEAKPTQITTDDNQRPSPFTSRRGGGFGFGFRQNDTKANNLRLGQLGFGVGEDIYCEHRVYGEATDVFVRAASTTEA